MLKADSEVIQINNASQEKIVTIWWKANFI
jgi:hypothetical protein